MGASLAKMAREQEKTVAEFVRAELSFTAWTVGPPEPKASSMALGKWETSDLLADLELAVSMGTPHALSSWERDFADDITRWKPTFMTEKQAQTIKKIIAKLA